MGSKNIMAVTLLEAMRRADGLTQDALAERLGISKSVIGRIESHKPTDLKVSQAEALTNFFLVGVAMLSEPVALTTCGAKNENPA